MNKKRALSEELIHILREEKIQGESLAGVLMEILCIGKEAVYRRLRGEVPFSFEEASVISRKFGISLDKVAGNCLSDGTRFDLNMPYMADPVDSYCDILKRYTHFFGALKNDPSTDVCTAANVVPYTFYSPYESLSRFRLYRWVYQHRNSPVPLALSELEVSEQVKELHFKLSDEIRQSPRTSFIWDVSLFESFIKEVRYFYRLGLITDAELEVMRKDMLLMLDETEALAAAGEFSRGKTLDIYLSHLNFEASYSYIEKKDFQICLFRVYATNTMDSQNVGICSIQKDWLQFLKRHSTLISQSGEIQRITFFNAQREAVGHLADEAVLIG